MNASELAERLSQVIYPIMILAGMAWGATGDLALGLAVVLILGLVRVLGSAAKVHPAASRERFRRIT
jgi:hypothetical protein